MKKNRPVAMLKEKYKLIPKKNNGISSIWIKWFIGCEHVTLVVGKVKTPKVIISNL